MNEWRQKHDLLTQIADDAARGNASKSLQSFYSALDELALSSDMMPVTVKTYETIAINLSWPELQPSLEFILDKYEDILRHNPNFVPNVAKKHPAITTFLFPKIYKKMLESSSPNNIAPYSKIMAKLIIAADAKTAQEQIDCVCILPPNFRNNVLGNFGEIYAENEAVRDYLFQKFMMYNLVNSADDMKRLVSFVLSVVSSDDNKIQACIDVIRPYLNSKLLSDQIFEVMKVIYEKEEYRDQAIEMLNILKERATNNASLRKIARIVGNIEVLRSSVSFGHRVDKTAENQYGYETVDFVSVDKPCVIFFGGTGTTTAQAANGNMSPVEQLLKARNIDTGKVDIYGIVYDFGNDDGISFQDGTARFLQMMQYKHAKKINPTELITPPTQDDYDPQYVRQIFDKVFLSRISHNGVRLPFKVALKNIRNITVVTHCHGAYTFLKIEELMQSKMRELGYSPVEMEVLQKQLLCVSYAPYCPLGVSKSTMVSFASADDWDVEHHNQFYKTLKIMKHTDMFKTSWFPGRRGNVFVVPKLRVGECSNEHNSIDYNPNAEEFSEEGKKLVKLIGNAIVGGVQSSIKGTPLPSIKTLLTAGNADDIAIFEESVQNGEDMYSQIVTRIYQNHLRERQATSGESLVFWHKLFSKLREAKPSSI